MTPLAAAFLFFFCSRYFSCFLAKIAACSWLLADTVTDEFPNWLCPLNKLFDAAKPDWEFYDICDLKPWLFDAALT